MIIISSIHGNERGGPPAIMEFAKWLKKQKVNGKIMIVPIMNCLAWDRKERSPKRLNMNRIWNEAKCHRAPQVQEMMKIVKKQKPLIWLDLHADSTITDNKPYIFRNVDCEWGKELQKNVGVSVFKGITNSHDYETSESYAHSVGVNKSFTTESNPYDHIDIQVEFQRSVIDYCFKWVNNKENWENGKL